MGFLFVYFSNNTVEKLKVLKTIDDKLSVFFSAKSNVIEKSTKDAQVILQEEIRLIAPLTEGNHPFARAEIQNKNIIVLCK